MAVTVRASRRRVVTSTVVEVGVERLRSTRRRATTVAERRSTENVDA
jgi:hypothetical protein